MLQAVTPLCGGIACTRPSALVSHAVCVTSRFWLARRRPSPLFRPAGGLRSPAACRSSVHVSHARDRFTVRLLYIDNSISVNRETQDICANERIGTTELTHVHVASTSVHEPIDRSVFGIRFLVVRYGMRG